MTNAVFFIYLISITVMLFLRRYIAACVFAGISVCHMFILQNRHMPFGQAAVFSALVLLFDILYIFFVYKYNFLFREMLNKDEEDLRQLEGHLDSLSKKSKVLLERNSQLERSLNEITTVYDYVKRLGSTMEFNEAVDILKKTLSMLIQFSTGKLVILQDGGTSEVYGISSDGENTEKNDTFSLNKYEQGVISKVKNNQHVFIYEKNKLSSVGTFPGNIETLVAVPLIAEKQTVAVVIFENIQLNSIEKINFIMLQFSMEVKKTQLYEKVKELSKIDSLTQLYLRRHFMNLLDNEMDRGYRQNQYISFLMLDVDYFKRYNDEYGHLIGDLVLKKIAGILKDRSREIDLLCRYGGDEFALVLPRTTIQDAYSVAERLRRAVSEYLFQVAKEQFQVTVSIGVSACNPKDMRLDGIKETLIDYADKALYKAKSLGRNKVILWT